MVHYRQTFHTYLFFAASLLGLRRNLGGLRAFGTDGEKALADAFAHEFRYATHLTCFIHFRRNMKRELNERGFTSKATNDVIDDILGCQKGNVFCEGLVDCKDQDDVHQKLKLLEKRWEDLEDQQGLQHGFYQWFCEHKVHTVEQSMLKQVREDAGLGCPPDPFTTNVS